MDYSIKHLFVTDDIVWTRDMLWSYGQVEKITIIGNWIYKDDDCSNFCLYLRNLKEFEVLDSIGVFFTEDGALYANIKCDDIVNEDSRFCYLCGNVEGKMLVAVPTAYPCKHFRIAEGTTCICPGVFAGLKQIESICFPKSIEYLDFHCLDDMPNLKKLYIPNKKVTIMDHFASSCKKPVLECIDAHQTLSDEVKKSWWFWWDWKLPIGGTQYVKSFGMDRKPVFLSKEMENAILTAVTDKDAFFSFYRECIYGKPQNGQLSLFPIEEQSDIKLALLLMLVEPRILHPETKEEAVDIINMLFGDARTAMEADDVKDVWGEFARMDFDNPEVFQQIKEKINSQWESFGVVCPWEDDDLLDDLRYYKEKCLMAEAAVSDPITCVNNLDYRTILIMLRDKAETLFHRNVEKDIYALLNYLYMQKEYRNENSSSPYNIKYLKLAANQGDLISLWELSKVYDDESSRNNPELRGDAYLCWKMILSEPGIGISQKDANEIKSWAEQCIKQSIHDE